MTADSSTGEGDTRLADTEDLSALPSRTEAVSGAIERAIFDGVYEPGDRLVERELAQRLGVSKTPVREALKVLAGKGIVAAHPYRGMRVLEITHKMVRNLYGVRLLLEPAAVHESVGRFTEASHEAAREALEAGAAAAQRGDLGGLALANRRFHRALSARCSNELLMGILDELRDRAALIVVWNWRSRRDTELAGAGEVWDSRAQADWERQADEHAAILAAAEEGDADLAAQRLKTHVERAMASALAQFEDEGRDHSSSLSSQVPA